MTYPKRIPDAVSARPYSGYTCVRNDFLRDPRLSFKAKGILTTLLSNRSGKWISYLKTLQNLGTEGLDAINSGIKELEKFGYLIRVHYVDKETKRRRGSFWAYTDTVGHFEMEQQMDVLEENGMEIQSGNAAWSVVHDPYMENPYMDYPHMENPQLIILNNKKTNNKRFVRRKKSEIKKEKINALIPEDKKVEAIPPKKPSIKERTEQFIPLASKLAVIVRSTKNIKVNHTKIVMWANEIRKMYEVDGIEYARVEKALEWYADHIGGQYIPVIESGSSFREKFLRLEAAMERAGALVLGESASPPKEKPSASPQKILRSHFPNSTLRKAFVNSCYKPARALFSSGSQNGASELAEVLSQFHFRIADIQGQHFTNDMRQSLPEYSPMSVVQAYLSWIGDNDWIVHRKPSLLNTNHKLFRNFCREWAFEVDHMARSPLTGDSLKRE